MIVNGGKKLLMAGAAVDPDAKALFARMSPAPDGMRKKVINRLIRRLRVAGVWTRLDTFYVFAAHSSQAALLDWKRSNSSAALISGATIVADVGAVTAAGGARVATNFDPRSSGQKYAAADASFACWGGTYNGDAPTSSIMAGAGISNGAPNIVWATGAAGMHGNDDKGSPLLGSERFMCTSLAASVQNITANTGNSSYSAPIAIIPNNAFLVGAYYNQSGLVTAQGAYPRRMFMAGASLTEPQMNAAYTAIREYLTSIGVPA